MLKGDNPSRIRWADAYWIASDLFLTQIKTTIENRHHKNPMPTEYIVSLLIAERDKLNRAIAALQGSGKRRGRPPKNPLAAISSPAAAPVAKKRKRRSTAQRKAQAERMKAYWAAKRKKAK